jgi:hypothetical protein
VKYFTFRSLSLFMDAQTAAQLLSAPPLSIALPDQAWWRMVLVDHIAHPALSQLRLCQMVPISFPADLWAEIFEDHKAQIAEFLAIFPTAGPCLAPALQSLILEDLTRFDRFASTLIGVNHWGVRGKKRTRVTSEDWVIHSVDFPSQTVRCFSDDELNFTPGVLVFKPKMSRGSIFWRVDAAYPDCEDDEDHFTRKYFELVMPEFRAACARSEALRAKLQQADPSVWAEIHADNPELSERDRQVVAEQVYTPPGSDFWFVRGRPDITELVLEEP